jgi:hypothetical protein
MILEESQKGQSNKKNGKSGSIKASANEASMKKKPKTLLGKVALRALQHQPVS